MRGTARVGLVGTVCVTALLVGFTMPRGEALNAQRQQDQPTFRTSTTLVEFTAVAQDAAGHPVTDLRQDEITVTENGKLRDVVFFRFEGLPEVSPPIRPAPLAPGIFSNRPEYAPGPPRNITAIVIDALNTQPADQLMVRAQVMGYLNTIAPDTRVAIYRAGETVQVLHDFTDDIQSLRARFSNRAIEAAQHTGTGVTVEPAKIQEWQLELMKDDPAQIELLKLAYSEMARFEEQSNQQIQNRRSDYTLRSLEILGNHLAAIPGRKSVIWITPGTPTVMVGAGDPWLKSYEAAIRNTAYRMATQGITVYPVEATGIRAPALGLNPAARGNTRGTPTIAERAAARAGTQSLKDMSTTSDERRLPSAMEALAEVTGGRMIRNTNDLTSGMQVAASDLRGTYSVGFYMAQEPDNRWHTFNVQVRRPGVKLIHRQGYLGVAAKQTEDWSDDDWRAAANNPLRSTAIRIDARVELGAGKINAIVVIPGEDLQFRRTEQRSGAVENGAAPVTEIDVALAEKTPTGLTGLRHEPLSFQVQEAQMNDLASVRIRFPKEWPIRPATTIVRLIVRDRSTGRHGTLDVPLTVVRK